ncbi:outer membrane beta-barrel protein [Roseomonas sp. JC162]|uniref:Outer membrane beta-barrel protein n=1 Tax=Neoroseomonas marina TaxID=1232220 RepID=A0A848EGD8_9PROT|nr:outer membrane beta-barrel protein [Neoroseomonas marina]NMJ42493.1 outer membrane beta-barrel protein [Neoroseomonas marina]
MPQGKTTTPPPSPLKCAVGGIGVSLALLPFFARSAAAQEDIRVAPDRGQTVMERSRPEVDPVGVRLGSFRLDASAAVGVGYDDNLLGTSTDRLGDGFVEESARASLVSDWTVHQLGVRAGIVNRTYFNEGNFDWTDWDASAFGRYDFGGDTSVNAAYTHSRLHLAPQSVDVQQAGLAEPVPYNVDQFDVGGTTRFNRVTLGLSATYAMYRYDNVPGPGGDVSIYDYNSLILRLDTGYEFVQGRSVTLGIRYQDVKYQDSISRDRDSQTWAALAGFRYDFDGVWAARIAVGYAWRDYEGPQFKSLGTPAVEANVTWNATALTTLNLTASRSIQESIRSTTASYVSNYAQLRVDHELLRNVILSGWAGVGGQEYQQPTQRATDLIFGAQATWLMNRHLALSLEYRYVDRVSATGGLQEYDENLVFLRLRAAL